jgi:glycerol uptake facilitator-like aquaporin
MSADETASRRDEGRPSGKSGRSPTTDARADIVNDHCCGLRPPSIEARLASEALGTAFLLMAVVGSGILGARLAGEHTATALLANSLATGAMLYALIAWLGPVSGAHLNPAVTLALALRGDIERRTAAGYVLVQVLGAFLGVAIGNAMFDAPMFSYATHVRSGSSQLLSEFVSTFGLTSAVLTCAQRRLTSTAGVVAAYIAAGFWFTASGFANPAVAVARAFTCLDGCMPRVARCE